MITSSDSISRAYKVSPFTTLHLNFELKTNSKKDTKQFIDIGREELGILYENKNGKIVEIGRAGARVPIPERSVKKDLKAIVITLKAHETKKLTLMIENFLSTKKLIRTQFLTEIEYQKVIEAKNNNLYQRYLSSGYLAILVMVLLLTIVQYFVLPERVFIYYFFIFFFRFYVRQQILKL